ncbi:MAG TPA: argininosuccinate lyase [Syntrophaceae bacterium]|nr:argininosuccinate lyase [Syntrophaceae bacterium]
MNKLLRGRFKENQSPSVEQFTASIHIDKRLYRFDIQGSMAHTKMLAKQGIIKPEEADQIIEALGEILREIERGDFAFESRWEDIHMNIEKALVERLGEVGEKLHTARSRNDQVALDMRLYLRSEIKGLLNLINTLMSTLVDVAKANIDVIMPGYTHMQRAQPILFSHYMMAYYEMFKRDGARLKDCLKRINVMPLGSAALAGTTFPIDSKYVAELLNFPEIASNSVDAVSDRDFIIEFLEVASIIMVHLSRLSEELVLWSTAEFDFIEISESFCTGSSIMPQKKNPDVPELVRGKTGRVFGHLVSLLTIMNSLPLAYNRDMQEDKEPLFDTVDTLTNCLKIYIQLLPSLKVKGENMKKATKRGFLTATDLADYLVRKGMSFRDAHLLVGRIIKHAIEEGKELYELSLNELKGLCRLIEEDVYDWINVERSVERRTSYGGTAVDNVLEAINRAERELKEALGQIQKP